ncbi:MAG: AAA family ATPase [Deltaproteobacteria bacterium]|nr:AAA family ATPase [Deltaproteobacteria bacterium]
MASRFHAGEFQGTSRFQVLRRIGAGGMGVVFEALDRERGVRVALKTLHSVDSHALFRLKNEFRSLQDVQHPNLVSLGELLEDNGQWFFTMELVNGVGFLAHVRPGDLAIHEASADTAESPAGAPRAAPEPVRLVDPERGTYHEERLRNALGQLANGLVALHSAGKVHRDIKPPNIVVTPEGRLVLLDFGLVTGTTNGQRSTDQHVVGTVDYMAPEQAASKPVGPEADWYSVGVILYEALAGRVPFQGAPLEVMMNKQKFEPAPPRALVPKVPPDLDALCIELLRFDPLARPSAREILARLGVEDRGEVRRESRSSTMTEASLFVGREAELGALWNAFEETQDGHAVGTLLVGEAGIGKSMLVRRFTDELLTSERGVVVLYGRCYESEMVPFKGLDGVIDALARYMCRLPDLEAGALLPRQAGLLGQVFPVLRRVKAIAEAPHLHAGGRIDPQEARTRLFGAVRELLSRLTDRKPVVVVIEDLHWTDGDSLALLGEILRPPEAPPLLLIATVRPDSAGSDDKEAWRLVLGVPADLREVHLSHLSEQESLELAARLLSHSSHNAGPTAEAIAKEAAGHPLFIDELARAAAMHPGEAPMRLSLAEVLKTRLARVSEHARVVLELACVAGTAVMQDVVMQSARLSGGDFSRAVAQLRTGRLARVTGARGSDAIEPYHDRIRSAVLVSLSQETRTEMHRKLALALEGTVGVDPDILMMHWNGAGDRERTIRYAVQAAANAEAVLAFDHAANLYRTALHLHPDSISGARELRVKLAQALVNAGRGAEAAAMFLSAVPAAGAAEALELQRLAAEEYLKSGHIDEGLKAIRDVLGAVGMKLPESPRRALASLLLRRVQLRLRRLSYQERHVSQSSPEELVRMDVCRSVGVGLGMVDNICAAAFQSQALLLALKVGDPFQIAKCMGPEAVFVATGGGPAKERADRLIEEAQALARKLPQAEVRAWAIGAEGAASYLQGRWRLALEKLDGADKIIREECTGLNWERDSEQLFSTCVLFYLGELAELERRVFLLLREAEDRGDLYAVTNLHTGQANVAWLTRDDARTAQAVATEAVKKWSRRGFHLQHYYGLLAQVQADLYVGDSEAALAKVNERWQDLTRSLILRMQRVRLEALCLRARCLLATTRSQGPARARQVREVARLARRIEREHMPWSDPLALLLHAGVAESEQDTERAVVILQGAVKGFEAADMALHAACARRRLGTLLGGDAGRLLVRESDAWMSSQRVRNPERMAAMLAPGFP